MVYKPIHAMTAKEDLEAVEERKLLVKIYGMTTSFTNKRYVNYARIQDTTGKQSKSI